MLNTTQLQDQGRVSTGVSALVALSVCTLLPALGTSIANVALPALAEAFGASFQQVQWIVVAYLLASTILVVGAGRLGDLVGRRRLLLGGIALFAAASALGGTAGSLWLLIVARAAQGLGAAGMAALAMALIAETVPKARIGSVMGLLGTMSAVGTALGPSLGGMLVAGLGWRSIFLINLPLGALAFVLVRQLPADRAAQADRPAFDRLGMLVLGATLGAYALSMTIGRGSPGLLNAALLLAAVIGGALFLRVEAAAASPLVRPAMLRDPALGAGFAMSLLVTTVMMATLVVGPFYLARALGLHTALVGIAMSVGPVTAALGGVPAGRLVDRFGARGMTVGGLIGMGTGTGLLAALPATLGVAGYVLPMIVVTGGYALFQAANNTAVMADVPADRRGTVSGLLNLSRNLGLVTGATVMGAVFVLRAGDVTTAGAAAVAGGMSIVFALATVLIGVALAASRAGR